MDVSQLSLRDLRQAVAAARHQLRRRLSAFGDVAGDAELVLAELAANAILHGTPPVRIRLVIGGTLVRVEVADANPRLPLRPQQPSDAMTGRGLMLVESVSRRWGMDASAGGKVVWAELVAPGRPVPARPGEYVLAEWGVEGLEAADGEAPRYPVHLGHVPTSLLLEAKAHVDNLVRELTLAAGAELGVPPHLAELVEGVVNRFSEARHEIRRQALQAAQRGEDQVSLDLYLPLEAAGAGREYLDAIDATDSYCRAARMLTLESSPQHRVFRHWYVEEIVRQLQEAASGTPPRRPQTFEERLIDEVAKSAASHRSAERAARLYSVTAALGAARSAEEVATAVLSDGAAALGASGGGVILFGADDSFLVPATFGYDSDVVERLRHERRDADLPAALALRTGQSVWLESGTQRDERFPELADMEPGTVSMCAVPLEVVGRRIGALRFSFQQPRIFDAEERSFVTALAAQSAQALERASLLEHSRAVAATLQAALVPPALPAIDGVDLAATYHPLGDGMEVGGDFYDIWPAGPGRWAFAIGDVCGTGAAAATMTGLVRHTLRARAVTDSDPGEILQVLNAVLLNGQVVEGDEERFCTAILGFFSVQDGGTRLRMANGGHPEPLLVGGSRPQALPLRGSLLGVTSSAEIAVADLRLGPGQGLLLYTDGVTDTRRPRSRDRFGEDRLMAAVAGGGARAIVDSVLDAVLAFGGGRLNDDVAVLVLKSGTAS